MYFVLISCTVHVVEEDRFEDMGEMYNYEVNVSFRAGFKNRHQARSVERRGFPFSQKERYIINQYFERFLKPRDWMNDVSVLSVGQFSVIQKNVESSPCFCDLSFLKRT